MLNGLSCVLWHRLTDGQEIFCAGMWSWDNEMIRWRDEGGCQDQQVISINIHSFSTLKSFRAFYEVCIDVCSLYFSKCKFIVLRFSACFYMSLLDYCAILNCYLISGSPHVASVNNPCWVLLLVIPLCPSPSPAPEPWHSGGLGHPLVPPEHH